jgi:NRAMP (natural resistance-associated macrophage protein)-like metal ion transporter
VTSAAKETPTAPKRAANADALILRLGPGLITGAADDDPSGIATYSQVGAQFGTAMLWTMLFSFPLMAAMQEICARLGRITGAGIAANLRKHYPKPLLICAITLLCVANVFNLGADIAAIGAAAKLVFGGNLNTYAVGFGLLSIFLQIYLPYRRYVRYLKWLTLALFAYVGTAFVVHVPWSTVLRATFVPSMQRNSNYWMGLIAVLGTTISPYLFFWQASEEAEEVRATRQASALTRKPRQAFAQFRRIAFDTRVGMALSNLIGFFIILTAALTLHTSASTQGIQTAADAAKALKPVAGNFAFLLFAIGIIGTGLLAIPVLAGSAAYGVAEAFHWRASLGSKPNQARRFYFVIAAATVTGLLLNFAGLDPIRALYWSAIVNGIAAAPLMAMLMIMSASFAVVREFTLPLYLRVVGWAATAGYASCFDRIPREYGARFALTPRPVRKFQVFTVWLETVSGKRSVWLRRIGDPRDYLTASKPRSAIHMQAIAPKG